MLKSTSLSSKPGPKRLFREALFEARTQILLWYAGLFLLLGSLGIPTFRWILFRRVDMRVRADLVEQMQSFKDTLEAESRDVPVAIDTFITTVLPEDDNYFVFFVDDRFYASSPRALPTDI